jgi:hypothetical protein
MYTFEYLTDIDCGCNTVYSRVLLILFIEAFLTTYLNVVFGNFNFWGVNVIDENPESFWIDVDEGHPTLVALLEPGEHCVEVGRAGGLLIV